MEFVYNMLYSIIYNGKLIYCSDDMFMSYLQFVNQLIKKKYGCFILKCNENIILRLEVKK